MSSPYLCKQGSRDRGATGYPGGLILSVFASVAVLACGARSSLLGSGTDGEQGGAGGSTGSSTGGNSSSSSSSTTSSTDTPTIPKPCPSLYSLGTVIPAWKSPGARLPSMGYDSVSRNVIVGFLDKYPGQSSNLVMGHTNAFSAWPPDILVEEAVAKFVTDQVLGPGPERPVGLFHSNNETYLATQVVDGFKVAEAPISLAKNLLFVRALPDRYFYGAFGEAPNYQVLDLGSYQPNSLPQKEDPVVCTPSPIVADSAISTTGFYAALAIAPENKELCTPQAPSQTGAVRVYHYQAPAEPGSFLESTIGAYIDLPEPVKEVHVVPASFGAWLVYQTNGSTSLTMPPVIATRLDPTGHQISLGEAIVAVPDGQAFGEVAVAPFGDQVAVVWVDSADPGAPKLVVQLVNPEGTLGPSVVVPTDNAWFYGELRALGSPSGETVLLAWEVQGIDTPIIALSRVDCTE
ncbi:MAG: hypothetical protein IPK82_32475 [Polyangiaceae bacterium]|nr:hypothetical protein [Polyangiaceae bacterium]